MHHSPRISPSHFLWLTLSALLLVTTPAFAADSNSFAEAVAKGPLYAAGIALLGGLLVSLTPCVYPMVAITVSVFGARQTKNHWHGLSLSSAFVLGIMCMFTPLGVVAGMTGSLFGAALQSPWVLSGIAVLFLAMAASMLGAFDLALPASLTNRLAEVGGVGLKGAFGLGLVCGLIAAPCTGPVLTGILTWIAKTQSAGAGAAAMAAFSFGLGVPFLIVGTFAVQLPKSGPWMVHVKSILAIVLIVVALYYLGTAFPILESWIKPTGFIMVVAGAVALSGLVLGAVHLAFDSGGLVNRARKTIGILATTVGGFVLIMALVKPERELDWQKIPIEAAQQAALLDEKPMLVDFTAAWCGACKELDKLTFAHPDVSREASRFVAVKIDATNDEDARVVKTMEALNVVGLPTVLLFDSKGKEVRRFTDFVDAEKFLLALREVD